jgi:hypothetical protein
MKSKFILPVAFLLSILTINASAQNHRSLGDENRRIREGARSGELSTSETARLNREKAQLRRESIRYEANDGHIGPRERANLCRDNTRLARNIFRQKHDRQRVVL